MMFKELEGIQQNLMRNPMDKFPQMQEKHSYKTMRWNRSVIGLNGRFRTGLNRATKTLNIAKLW